jgi:hypothetical protein
MELDDSLGAMTGYSEINWPDLEVGMGSHLFNDRRCEFNLASLGRS